MKVQKMIKLLLIMTLVVLFGCSTSIPQPLMEKAGNDVFRLEIHFPENLQPVNHEPVPDDPIGLVEKAMFLSEIQGKHNSAGQLYMKAGKILSAGGLLAVHCYTAAAIEYITDANVPEFLNTGEKLEEAVGKLEFRIISSETEEILNLYNYISSDGEEISQSLNFLTIHKPYNIRRN